MRLAFQAPANMRYGLTSIAAPGFLSFASSLRSGLYLQADELEALQLARLRRLVGHAHENVPYYRKLFDSVGFQPRHLRRLSDIQAIPVTTRDRLQKIPHDEIISRTAQRRKLRTARTSGSSGMPLTVYRTRHETRLRRLLTLRAFRQTGLRWTDRVVTISRQPTGAGLPWFKSWPRAPLWNLWFFEEPEQMISSLRRLKPTVLYGFATNLAILADLMLQKGIDDVRPRLLASSSDLLLPGFRRVMTQAFQADPLDIYNCTELGDIGWQCQRRKGFHLNADWLQVEVLRSGKAAGPGEFGEVVVTQLYRYAMPLIRYSPGDVATVAEAPCSCGLGLPMLGGLEGRSQNIVPLPGGRVFVGFSEIMSEFPEVGRYQIVQTALDAFTIKVVPGEGYSEGISRAIVGAMISKLGEGVQAEVCAIDGKELGAPGKCPTVVPLWSVDFSNG